MRLIDYLLLAIVAVCAVIAWRVWHHTMKKGGCCGSGCTGNCAQCGRNCDCKKEKSIKQGFPNSGSLAFLCVCARAHSSAMCTGFPCSWIRAARSSARSHTVAVLSFGCTPMSPGAAKNAASR